MRSTPSASGRRSWHRTFVALPLFLGVFALSLGDAFVINADLTAPQAGIVEAGKDRRGADLHGGGRLLLLPGSSFDLDEGRLLSGEAIFAHASLVSLKAGSLDLEGWKGAFGVSARGDTVTVAALTTPVIVRSGQERTVVPVGTQLRVQGALPALSDGADAWMAARWVLPLPAFYLREQMMLVDGMPEAAVILPQDSAEPEAPVALDVLRFAASQVRTDAFRSDMALDHALAAIRDGDTAPALALFQSASGSQAASLLRALPDILSFAVDQGKAALFMPLIPDDAPFRLLASFHPSLRDHAWVTGSRDALSKDVRFLQMLLFPRADILSDAVSPLASAQWRQDAENFLKEAGDDAPALLDAFLPRWAETVRLQAEALLPERTGRLVLNLSGIAAPYEAALAEPSRKTLAEMKALPDRLAAVRFDASSSASSSSLSSRGSSSSERVMGVVEYGVGKEKALGLLRAAGGMETPQTTVTVVHGDTVHVIDMVFASDTGDVRAEFSFDAGTNEVKDVMKDGRVLPYAIPLDAFVEWVKKGMR